MTLYNRMHKHCSDDTCFPGNGSMSIEAVALAELVSYIEEPVQNSGTVPLFKL